MKAYIFKVGGDIVRVEPRNGTDFSLEELKEAIGGGYIEIVRVGRDGLMVVDEEGKLKNMPVNHKATLFYANANDVIVGDALVCHRSQIK